MNLLNSLKCGPLRLWLGGTLSQTWAQVLFVSHLLARLCCPIPGGECCCALISKPLYRTRTCGAMRPSFQLLRRASGLQSPNRGPLAPWLVKLWVKMTIKSKIFNHEIEVVFGKIHFVLRMFLVGQKDHYKKLCDLLPPWKAQTKKWWQAKFFAIKNEGFRKKIVLRVHLVGQEILL